MLAFNPPATPQRNIRQEAPPAPPAQAAGGQGQPLVVDNSRALVPEYLGLRDGRLPVTPELAQLLGIEGNAVDLDAAGEPAAAFAEPGPARPPREVTAPDAVNHNVPRSSYRYLAMSVRDLLFEASQRAVDLGPPDAVANTNTGISPQEHRLGDMLFALRYQPGRANDLARLRQARIDLSRFFVDYRSLVDTMRRNHPELAPVIPEWSAELARNAIGLALQQPVGADGEPQYDAARFTAIGALLSDPAVGHVQTLRRLQDERELQAYRGRLDRFMSAIQAPAGTPVDPGTVRVQGASSSEVEGAHVRSLLRGNVVMEGSRQALVQALQLVPAGTIREVPPPRLYSSPFHAPPLQHSVAYPHRGSGNTLHSLAWIDSSAPAGSASRSVLVAAPNGTHSYSLDSGATWQATGGLHSAAIGDLRADAWRQLLVGRWHAHREANSRSWQGASGR